MQAIETPECSGRKTSVQFSEADNAFGQTVDTALIDHLPKDSPVDWVASRNPATFVQLLSRKAEEIGSAGDRVPETTFGTRGKETDGSHWSWVAIQPEQGVKVRMEKTPSNVPAEFPDFPDNITRARAELPIILLDLNYTLAANSRAVMIGRGYRVEVERYRSWLVDVIRDHHVLLLTVRDEQYRERTLRRIADQLDGWQPHEAHFRRWRCNAPECKQRMLRESIFPRYGHPAETRYLALESNDFTAAMYERHGIPRMRAEQLRPEGVASEDRDMDSRIVQKGFTW